MKQLLKIVHRIKLQIRARKILGLLKCLSPLSTDRELIRFGPKGGRGYLIPNDLEGIHALKIVHRIKLQIRARKILGLLKCLSPLSTDRELIRFGPKGDGGYLIPNDLEGIHACFSPGVSSISGFEKDCADTGMKVFLADASVDKPAEGHELFCFTKKFIGGTQSDNFMTLDDWVTSSTKDTASDLMLQIDIEGGEYEVFQSASESLMQRFRIIVAEFHYLDQLLNVSSDEYKEIIFVFNRILRTHSCVHIHPNNYCGFSRHNGIDIPRVTEFTFLRNDRIEHPSYQISFPHPLDCDNVPKNPTLILPKCWYGEGEVALMKIKNGSRRNAFIND